MPSSDSDSRPKLPPVIQCLINVTNMARLKDNKAKRLHKEKEALAAIKQPSSNFKQSSPWVQVCDSSGKPLRKGEWVEKALLAGPPECGFPKVGYWLSHNAN